MDEVEWNHRALNLPLSCFNFGPQSNSKTERINLLYVNVYVQD